MHDEIKVGIALKVLQLPVTPPLYLCKNGFLSQEELMNIKNSKPGDITIVSNPDITVVADSMTEMRNVAIKVLTEYLNEK
jgi:hypothetical protein